ncbi:2-C-methyl-D-erythritol 4-phosphate cytidylyltransferase [Sphingomonas aurantiaca]|uniref:2-C-methyl-D-erythritol 4-phosphate cytidylyltransferase n=1 Tax=Sphingomonas aurantiaca TaxID=185949 RepID=UPI002FE42361
MAHGQRIVAIIVAAGTGVRAGGAVPKQYARIGGRPMIAYSHDAFAAHPAIAETIVVVAAGQQRMAIEALDCDATIVVGGATRREVGRERRRSGRRGDSRAGPRRGPPLPLCRRHRFCSSPP